MNFEDLKFNQKSGLGGNRAQVHFDNSYGASVIDCGYGSESGLYELAVLKDGDICYSTHLTADVLGHLTPEDVTTHLEQIEAL